jgi:hypothetical protein
MMRRALPSRFVIGFLGGVALILGLWAGLILLKLDIPSPRADFKDVHGPLMVLGFFGTLIALERAVALGDRTGYFAPAFAGLGGFALAIGLPLLVGQMLLLLGGLGLFGLYVRAAQRQSSLHLGVMAVGAIIWAIAVLAWIMGRDLALLVPFLAGFVILTIAGERLELARVIRLSGATRTSFVIAVGIFTFGIALSLAALSLGVRIAGVGLIALAGWLAKNDVARRTVHQCGLTRFMALSLLTGYAWLATAGVIWLSFANLTDGRAFDALIHSLFLGFVMSMVFAHAPVIVPAVFRVAMPYHKRFYFHLYLLHISLLIRLVGGDLAGDRYCWQIGGILNEIAVLVFIGSSGTAIYQEHKSKTSPMPEKIKTRVRES